MENDFYVYVYLDNRKPGKWTYCEYTFDYQPFYIGRGKRFRMNNHLQPKQRSNNSIKSNTINAIFKQCGVEPIRYKIKEGLSFEDANVLERNIISHFGRIDNQTGILTNFTDGGEGFKNVIFTDATKARMSIAAKGTKTNGNNGMSLKVEQHDLGGNYINTYDSMITAQQATGVSFKQISNCSRGVTKTAGGFIWKSLGRSYKPIIKAAAMDRRKPIYQYTLDGEFVKAWGSGSEAATVYGSHVMGAALGKFQNIKGFQWRYEQHSSIPSIIERKLSFKGSGITAKSVIEVTDYLAGSIAQRTISATAKHYDITMTTIRKYLQNGEVFLKMPKSEMSVNLLQLSACST